MKDTLTLAQIQMTVPEEKAAACEAAEKMMDTIPAGTDVIVLPEMFCCPYETARFADYAEKRGGGVWRWAHETARKRGCYLIAGSMPERGEDGRLYNTSYVFDRQGVELARHRKMHLFDIGVTGGQSYRESAILSPGDHMTTFQTEFGAMGLCICFDIRFPELFRAMQKRGARVIFVPAAFNQTTGPLHWELLFRAHAAEYQLFTVGAAPAYDPHASYQSWGHSIVCDPWGRVVSQADDAPGVFVTTLDLNEVDSVRRQIPLD